MGFFFQGYTLTSIVVLVGVIACIMFVNEVTRRSKLLSILAYCIVPVLLFIAIVPLKLLGSPSAMTWFGWVKTISSLIGVIGFMIMRYTKIGKAKYACYFPVLILVINIIEAIYRDYEVYKNYATPMFDEAGLYLQGGCWNLMNAVAGIFLLLTLTGWMGIKISNTKSKDLVWPDQLWFWIIAYDLWNISYCYNSISTRAMYAGVAIIIACTLCELFCRKGVWLQHRAQTLAIFAMFSLAVDYQALDCFSITSTYDPNALFVVALCSLVANVGVFIYELFVICKMKRNPLKEEMFTHLKGYKENIEVNHL